jgi:hypothetical protein
MKAIHLTACGNVELYDLLYATLIARDYPVVRLEVVSTFLKKSIFGPQPTLAKEERLALPSCPSHPILAREGDEGY